MFRLLFACLPSRQMGAGVNVKDISARLWERHRTDRCPNTERIIVTLKKIRAAIFPGYFYESREPEPGEAWMEVLLTDICRDLSEEMKADTAMNLILALTGLQQLLYKDAQAGFDGDPAARSIDEVILTYPGFFAVFVYRIAHFLFTENVPYIPRIMSEYAHSITGIDIHPGASIGEYFFIDHGTGVVIGETAVIGNHVKLYQGVTVGALSTDKGQGLKERKRHPTLEDHVTVYSGASILGGGTVIGTGAVIGGNAFIVKSVSANTIVKTRPPELQYKDGNETNHSEFR